MPKRILQGTVVSDKGDKTVIVRVERRIMHPIYRKYLRRSKRYPAHDETNQYKTGDLVRIGECRPLSKTKSWEVLGTITAAEAAVSPHAGDAAAAQASAAQTPAALTPAAEPPAAETPAAEA